MSISRLPALLPAVGLSLALLAGCGGGSKPDPVAEDTKPADNKSTPAVVDVGKPADTKAKAAPATTPVARDKMHVAFAEAVRDAENVPDGVGKPADETMTKKPTARIFEAVKNSWDTVRFATPDGRKLALEAHVETSAGKIVITLYPEQAPNHVRSFVALARAGYYDGLLFDTIHHETNPMTKLEVHRLEAGCPIGTGATGTGSIGYWLKSEFSQAAHEEGTVGAVRGEDPDSAGTKFYITLAKTPAMDGNHTVFGKVTQGLDVVRTMGRTPVIMDEEGGSRPKTALVVTKVTIVEK